MCYRLVFLSDNTVYKLDIGALLRRGVVGYLLVGGAVLCVGHHILARGLWCGSVPVERLPLVTCFRF
jgi:hypothetical protein